MKKILTILMLLQLVYSASNAQIKLIGNITTNGKASYPTHIDSLGKGGMMVMPTIGSRDSIPLLRRKFGMLVYVQENDSLYKLKNTASAKKYTDSSDWVTIGLNSTADVDRFLKYAKTSDSLFIIGNTRIDSNLYVKGGLRIGGKLELDSGLVFKDSLTVTRGARIDSSLILKGKLLLRDSLVATGNGLIKGKVQLDSNFYVKGSSIFDKHILVNTITIGNGSNYDGRNTGVGYQILRAATTGYWNDAFGNNSMFNLTNGAFNSSFGGRSMYTNISGNGNVSFGFQSLYNNLADSNAAFGYNAGFKNTTGTKNTFIGWSADADSVNLINATAIGAGAIVKNSNTLQLGNTSLNLVNTSGSFNSARTVYAKNLFAYDTLIVKGNYSKIDSNLIIGKDLYVGGKLTVGSGLEFKDSLLVTRGARIDSSLLVKQKIIVKDSLLANANVKIDSSLYVNKKAVINDSLSVIGFTRLGDSLSVKGYARLGDSLSVAGYSRLGDSLSVKGYARIGDSLTVKGDATVGKDLYVGGKLTVASGLTFKDSLVVTRGARIDSSLLVKQKIIVNDSLLANANVKIDSNLNVTGKVQLDSTLFVNRVTSLNDSLYVKGKVMLDSSLYVSKSATLNDSLNVKGKVKLDSSLYVVGNADFYDTVNIRNRLFGNYAWINWLDVMFPSNFESDLTIKGSLDVKTNTTLNTLNGKGRVQLDSTLFVNRVTSLNDSLYVKGKVMLDSSLYVKGKTKITDSILAKANVVIDSNLYVKGGVRIGGKLELDYGLVFNDSLTVTRGARIDSSLLLKGKLYVKDSLVSSGNALIKGKVQIDSNFYVKGSSTFDKHILVNTITIGNGSNYDGRNTGVGYQILRAATTGYWNDAFGNNSMFNLTNGAFNSSFGGRSMYTNVSGNGNASFGYQSLFNNLADSNAAFGYNAGFKNTTGTKNTFIGWSADADSVNLINATALGAGAIVKNSNTLQLGNTSLNLVNTSGSINSSKTIFANKLLAYDSLIVRGNTAISGNLFVKGANILTKFTDDSTTMLNNLIDSSNNLNARINLKVNIADTADMLTNRIQRDTSYLVQKSDTAAMLNSRFARDTVSISNRIDVLANSTSSEKITFTKDFPVRIAPNKTFGKYMNTDTVRAKGKTLDELLTDIVTEIIHPTYNRPTISISATPSPYVVEYGSSFPVTLSVAYTQNQGGALISTTYKKNGVNIGDGVNSDSVKFITTNRVFTAISSFAKGEVRNNNLSLPDSTNIILAGSTNESTLTYSPALKKYWGAFTDTTGLNAIITNSVNFEWATGWQKNLSSITTSGLQYIYYAYPVSVGPVSNGGDLSGSTGSGAISVGGFDSFNAFYKITRTLTNAYGYSATYNIYIAKNAANGTVSNIIIN